MRHAGPLIFLGAFLAAGIVPMPPAQAAKPDSPPPREVTGLEWLESSLRERTESLARSMLILQEQGVSFERTPVEYYADTHTWLRHHPADYETALTRIVARCVYEKEPGQRRALERTGFRP